MPKLIATVRQSEYEENANKEKCSMAEEKYKGISGS
jgi:hypothetical protein